MPVACSYCLDTNVQSPHRLYQSSGLQFSSFSILNIVLNTIRKQVFEVILQLDTNRQKIPTTPVIHTSHPFPMSLLKSKIFTLNSSLYNPISFTVFNATTKCQVLFGLWTPNKKNNVSITIPSSSLLGCLLCTSHTSTRQ